MFKKVNQLTFTSLIQENNNENIMFEIISNNFKSKRHVKLLLITHQQDDPLQFHLTLNSNLL